MNYLLLLYYSFAALCCCCALDMCFDFWRIVNFLLTWFLSKWQLFFIFLDDIFIIFIAYYFAMIQIYYVIKTFLGGSSSLWEWVGQCALYIDNVICQFFFFFEGDVICQINCTLKINIYIVHTYWVHFQSIFQILPVNGYSTATGGAMNFIFSKIILVSQQLYKMLFHNPNAR